MMPYILILVGFALLIKGADFLVDGAASLARHFGVSDLVIGLTVVAFGTSAPELLVSVVASLGGNSEIALGNVLGSNVANVLLVLAIGALMRPLAVTLRTVRIEIPFCALAAVMIAVLGNDIFLDGGAGNVLGRADGIVLLVFFALFMVYIGGTAGEPGSHLVEEIPEESMKLPVAIVAIVGGLVGLVLGANLAVRGAVDVAAAWGVSQSLIGLSIVALGTSLPELATTVAAARRGKSDIAVGNVVGSNIFNIFLILGVAATIKPIAYGPGTNVDVLVVIASSLVLLLTMFTGRKPNLLERWEGAGMVGAYIAYIVYIAVRG